MARFPARVLALPLVAAVALTAACGGKDGDKSAADSVASSDTNGQIQLVNGTAQQNGLTGDGQGDAAAAAGTGSAPASSAPAATATPAKWVQLSTNDAAIGTTVTDVRGFTLYRFDKDSPKPPKSTCAGDCAVTWPPLLIQPGGRVFVDGIKPDRIGAIRRADGGVQVTLNGWPMYFFAKDKVPGDLNGQGVGGTWFAFKPTGEKNDALITATAAKPAKPDETTKLSAKRIGNGVIVSDADGATLYTNAQGCDQACLAQWRPVTADNNAKLSVDGVEAKRVGTKKYDDGHVQLTLDGAPLYRNNADKTTGTVIASAAEQGWNPAA